LMSREDLMGVSIRLGLSFFRVSSGQSDRLSYSFRCF
jgi:hypothetical protein